MTRRLPSVAALVAALPALAGILYAVAAAIGLAGFGARGFTVDRIARVLSEAAVWHGLFWTVGTAAAATLLASAGAVVVAVAFRGSTAGDRVARGFAVLPLAVPHIVAATVFVLLFGQSGAVARLLVAAGIVSSPVALPALVYDPFGVGYVLTLAWKELPFLALLAFTVLATRGTALEETARSLGAGPRDVFRRVTWPILWRGLLPGVVAVFAFVAGSYEAAVLLAPSDPLALPLLTAERYTDPELARRGDAFVLVLLGSSIAAVAVALHEWARARAEPLDA